MQVENEHVHAFSTDGELGACNACDAADGSHTATGRVPLAVFCDAHHLLPAAETVAKKTGAPVIQTPEDAWQYPLLLKLDELGLSLASGKTVMRGDFARMAARIAKRNLSKELVVRAAKVKDVDTPLVIDATAGLGEDSFLLAAAGFRVELFERDPVIAALLEDALNRAKSDPALQDIAARMNIAGTDSVEALSHLNERPDVVLLDPMFPEKRKNAQAKKKLQLIQMLERPCSDEDELLEAALSSLPRKIVIKRPAKGPFLAGRKPDYSLTGKTVRYDCIVIPRK
ncbi:MAG: class I SAM-dependent methyltransferase [Eggerthellaceae bacterium]|nr:class I SAM-dependent methyltransferase [Eggerthellaceae bacterium]